MPTLKDTEWRLLCVVVRQTLGWSSNGKRKCRDWLTQRQFCGRSGRSSEAISRAIDQLVRKGLIEVQDQEGMPLITPAERRRYQGRLYYRLGSRLLDKAPHKNEQINVKSEVAKANTTKESGTKYLSIDRDRPFSSCGNKPLSNIQPLGQSSIKTKTNPEVREFLYIYKELFKRHSFHGDFPVIAWGRDSKIVKGLLDLYSYERLTTLLEQFFISSNPWFRKQGYSLMTFKNALNELLVGEPVQGIYQPKKRSGGWSPASNIREHNNAKSLHAPA